jgi:hypothetical protein
MPSFKASNEYKVEEIREDRMFDSETCFLMK